jgi:23S rRNA-/tRNA-specific pseudouridylate synthase
MVPLEVLFEDNHILVVIKPVNISGSAGCIRRPGYVDYH